MYATPVRETSLKDRPISNPIIRQINALAEQTMKEIGEPNRIQVRERDKADILRVFTLSTDHTLRFSCLRDKPESVHVNVKRYLSVFDDHQHAGWKGIVNVDFRATNGPTLSAQALTEIKNMMHQWLSLNKDSARSSREPFPCIDNTEVAKNEFVAATFVIGNVHIKAGNGEDYSLTFFDRTGDLSAKISGKAAAIFQAPEATVGCRAIIHHDGTVRIMRESVFKQFYFVI